MTDPESALFTSAAARRALHREADAFVDRATAMIHRARMLVVADRLDAAPLLAGRRAALSRHLHLYQQFKHCRVFDPVVAHGTASSRVVARTLKAECVQMGGIFGAYHARWSRMEAGEWPRYRRDMIETVDLLLIHLEAERGAIRQLLMISDFYKGSPLLAAAAARAAA